MLLLSIFINFENNKECMKKKSRINIIKNKMIKDGLDTGFTNLVAKNALTYKGVYDLMNLWMNESSKIERKKTVTTLSECNNDIQCLDDLETTKEKVLKAVKLMSLYILRDMERK